MTQRTSTDDWSRTDVERRFGPPREMPTGHGDECSHRGTDAPTHLAAVYESHNDQFDTVAPFVQRGLERGERCVYIADDNRRAEVLTELDRRGVDVAEALKSGALSVHAARNTYRRNGNFDPDEMLDFLEATMREAVDDGYDALRVTGEMTWIPDGDATAETVVEYEAALNELLVDADCVALCQYDREHFSPAFIRDVVRTHPHLVVDGTVCPNDLYGPPSEVLGPDDGDGRVERLLRTVRDRARTAASLERCETFLERSYEITSDLHRSFETKVRELLALGREWFGFDVGYFTVVDAECDTVEVVEAVGSHRAIDAGMESDLGGTYCEAVIEGPQPLAIADVETSELAADPGVDTLGLGAFLGTTLVVDGELYGTVGFGARTPRTEGFSQFEYAVVDLMSQWVSYELERQLREDRLAALNALARDLMSVESANAVCEEAVTVAREELGLSVSAMALYDDDTGRLMPTAASDAGEALIEHSALLESEQGSAGWRAFVDGATCRAPDPFRDREDSKPVSVSEVAVVPLETHGVFVVGSTRDDGFCPNKLDFAETVAANAAAALDRVDRDRRIQDRESTLAARNERLERVSRVNDIIRTIDQALVQASSRTEIEDAVCEGLADSRPYELAWIGQHDRTTETIQPTAWAGGDERFLDEIRVRTDGNGESAEPTSAAFEREEPVVVNDTVDADWDGPLRQEALNRGFHACIALPMTYEGSLYGVLNVYAGSPGVFDDLERTVLAELADTIAHAINAVESKKALVSDEVCELEFAVTDGDSVLFDLARATGRSVRLDTVVPRDDGRFRGFASTRGISADALRAAASKLDDGDVSVLSSHDADGETLCLTEFTVADGGLLRTIVEHGGRPHEFTVADGSGTAVVHVAADADVREFVSTFQSACADAELLAQRRRERPTRTATGFRAAIGDELTDRQLEAIQTAYFSGYFERPRSRNASDVAETMDITQPTFTAHLRAAQQKLFAHLFEERPRTADE